MENTENRKIQSLTPMLQAAEILGVRSCVAVCLQIRKVDERMKKDRDLQRHLAQIEKLLRQREKKVNLFHKG